MAELRGKSRRQHLAFKRQIAMYLVREITGASFPVTGACFGKDHSTMIQACQLIEQRMAAPAFNAYVTALKERITYVDRIMSEKIAVEAAA